jgi:hypothetical protein
MRLRTGRLRVSPGQVGRRLPAIIASGGDTHARPAPPVKGDSRRRARGLGGLHPGGGRNR